MSQFHYPVINEAGAEQGSPQYNSQSKSYLHQGVSFVREIEWSKHANKIGKALMSGNDTINLHNEDDVDMETQQLQHHLRSKDELLWSEFSEVQISTGANKQKKLYLILAYANGFQVHDVTEPKNVQEIISRREKAVKFAKILCKPDEKQEIVSSLYDKYPLIAIVYKDEPTKVNFFSLKTHESVHELSFSTEVNQICSNPHVLIICDQSSIYWFNNQTLEKDVNSLECYPLHNLEQESTEHRERFVQLGPVALGQRWIAYPSPNIVTNKKMDYTQHRNQTIAEISMDVAKKVASTTLYLGDIGYKQLSNVINGPTHYSDHSHQHHHQQQQQQHSINPSNSYMKAGTIEVRDVKTKDLICHFKAHSEPIAAMTFDPSGTLLVTVSIKGTNLNVYQIMPSANGRVGPRNVRHIYRLLRGVTSANIHNIQFSINSRWISVCSDHGTTHLFAINPNGGPVDPIEFVSSLYDAQIKLSHSQESDASHHDPIVETNPITFNADKKD
ncbi:autophagy-related protein 18 [Acrasis kona]|uniref:Autophagy-related protein 18 n=1 Tax=Acrasis kona TaxID=1008807 RepID=A0AAW2ZDT4_9EUKA